MAWTDGVDKSTGDIITAATWNNYFGASGDINLTAPYLASAAGDLFQATGSKVLARLAKGTRNQYLQTNSSTNAAEWAASPASLMDAKGEVISASGANTLSALAAGTNDYVLTADSSTTTGLKWAAASSGDAAAKTEAQWPLICGPNFTGQFDMTVTANRAYFFPLMPIISADVTITSYVCAITSSTGSYHIGLYTFDGSTLTRQAQSASTSVPGAADPASLTGLSTTMTAGTRYFGAVVFSGTPAYKVAYGDQGIKGNGYYVDVGSYSLPSTQAFSGLTMGNACPLGFFLNGGTMAAS
jgi:hypothetical protein